MQLTASARLLIFVALFNLAAALGINCRGNGGNCVSAVGPLTRAIEGIDRGRWFANEEQIACVTITETDDEGGSTTLSTCAFLQNTGGAWGSRILEFYPEDNDVSHGELTYITVRRPCSRRDGLCYVTTASSANF